MALCAILDFKIWGFGDTFRCSPNLLQQQNFINNPLKYDVMTFKIKVFHQFESSKFEIVAIDHDYNYSQILRNHTKFCENQTFRCQDMKRPSAVLNVKVLTFGQSQDFHYCRSLAPPNITV